MINYLIKAFDEILYLGAISSILIICILLIKKVFGKVLSPKWHYYIWGLLLIRLLIPFTPESSFSALNLYNLAVEQLSFPVNVISAPIKDNVNVVDETFPDQPVTNTNSGKTGNTVTNITNTSEGTQPKQAPFRMILIYLWLSGMLVLTIFTICINIAFAINIRKNYKLYNNPRMNDILNECKRIMSIHRTILLYNTDRTRTPSLYASYHTKILVSEANLEELSDLEIKCIFLHELSHFKRKDIAVNWVITILQIVYFFNPLIWFAFYRLHEDCEISCDADALRYLGEEEHQSYGSTVIKLIKLYSETNFIPTTAGLWKHKSNYKRRIIMINNFKRNKWPSTLLTIIIILIVGLIGLTGCKKAAEDIGNNGAKDITTTTEDTGDNGATDITDTPKDTENNPTATVTVAPTNAPDSSDTSEPSNLTQFYGDWVINKVSAYGAVGTYSKEDAESLIGKSMSFTAESATYFGDEASYIENTAKNPNYETIEITNSDSVVNYRMTLDELGITTDSVTQVTVSDSEGIVCIFLVKDDNTLIVTGGGTYFELVRKTN